ncbi:hypothetical protein [Flavobacterium rhizosphaerae]|uniref:Uncharacterized protein n=1 Tax=Flavobacterium rhizosphaerae TaxID=3163298 RepID=A0ABW8YXS9_9FLAO
MNKIVQDATGDEINFPDVNDSDAATIGDTALINDKPATGEYVMPDGRTFIFRDGKLSKIIEDRSVGAKMYLNQKRKKVNPTAVPGNRAAGILDRVKAARKAKF